MATEKENGLSLRVYPCSSAAEIKRKAQEGGSCASSDSGDSLVFEKTPVPQPLVDRLSVFFAVAVIPAESEKLDL